ncbi:trypsin domain-containing protein [Phthorimaea operculella]|nr:trypsin domain-containing protein [Phthorimaea operculella]
MIFLIYTLLQFACMACFKYFDTENYDVPHSLTGLPSYAARLEDAPHHVLVYYARWYCSGSLISSRTVVTCASCFFKRDGESTYVKVGSRQYVDSRSQRITVIELKIHEFYRRLTPVDNDIALLFLERNVRLSTHVKKIPLAEPDVSLRLGQSVYVTGYGADNVPARLRNQLLRTTITIVKDTVCTSVYGHIITSSNYCGELYFTDNRLSDNGGGATLMNVLVGILHKPLSKISFTRWIVLNTQRYHEKYCNRTVRSEEAGSYEDYGIAMLKHKVSKSRHQFPSENYD